MNPPTTDHALDVWAIVIPEVQIAVVIAVTMVAVVWLWVRVMVKRLEIGPDRTLRSAVPSEVLIQVLEEISRNQTAVTIAIEHNTEAIESLRDLVRKNRCAYRQDDRSITPWES